MIKVKFAAVVAAAITAMSIGSAESSAASADRGRHFD